MVLVFRSKRADRVKIVIWDGSGLVLVWKQLEGGTFRWPPVVDGVLRLTRGRVRGAVLRDRLAARAGDTARFPRRACPRRIAGTMRDAGNADTPTLPEDPAALRALLLASLGGDTLMPSAMASPDATA